MCEVLANDHNKVSENDVLTPCKKNRLKESNIHFQKYTNSIISGNVYISPTFYRQIV